jgi:hypothetical protein
VDAPPVVPTRVVLTDVHVMLPLMRANIEQNRSTHLINHTRQRAPHARLTKLPHTGCYSTATWVARRLTGRSLHPCG